MAHFAAYGTSVKLSTTQPNAFYTAVIRAGTHFTQGYRSAYCPFCVITIADRCAEHAKHDAASIANFNGNEPPTKTPQDALCCANIAIQQGTRVSIFRRHTINLTVQW